MTAKEKRHIIQLMSNNFRVFNFSDLAYFLLIQHARNIDHYDQIQHYYECECYSLREKLCFRMVISLSINCAAPRELIEYET